MFMRTSMQKYLEIVDNDRRETRSITVPKLNVPPCKKRSCQKINRVFWFHSLKRKIEI